MDDRVDQGRDPREGHTDQEDRQHREVEHAAEVTVLGCTTRTFEVRGHHYAVVPVTGLTPDTTYPYEVAVDGE